MAPPTETPTAHRPVRLSPIADGTQTASPAEAPTAHNGRPAAGSRHSLRRDTAGIATLEWLLVIAAVGGFAAVMAVGMHGLIDDATFRGDDADARLIDAGIDAARISDDAVAALIGLENPSGAPERQAIAQARLSALEQQCKRLATAYPDAVESADWAWLDVPIELPPTPTPAPNDAETDEQALTDGRWTCRIGHRAP